MRRIRIVLLVVVSLIFLSILASRTAFVIKEQSKDDLLRLHVVANSNLTKDQLLKRRVRNKVIRLSKVLLSNANNANEAQEIIRGNLDYLSQRIEADLVKEGIEHQINLKLDKLSFPVRSYGNLTLPQGDYQALKVVIGEGAGANWWCVLFPPLCFVDSVDDSINLGKVKNNQNNKPDVKFKLKIVEYIKDNPKLVKKSLELAKILSLDY